MPHYDEARGLLASDLNGPAGVIAGTIHSATSKPTPVDADELPLVDSASSFSLKRFTWANLKTTLATWINANLIPASFTSVTSSTTGKVATTLGVGGATPSASGAGVSFPAAQSASTDPNTLDDYEEVSWVPTITSGAGSIALGSYTATAIKIGRFVVFNVVLTVTTTGVGTSTITIGGLPYTSAPSTYSLMKMTVNSYSSSLTNDGYQYINTSATTALWSNRAVSLIDATFFMHFSGFYLASA